ncbi:MAG: PQQ-dependent sugar dehydrogenase [Chloroflexi bacterium]|nr:PQQ-dependent sugar dehydrogenase [Chloroflexota bacterium]
MPNAFCRPSWPVVPTVVACLLMLAVAFSGQPPSVSAQATDAADPTTLRLGTRLVTDQLEQPTAIAYAGDGSGRLFVVEKAGRIAIVRNGVRQQTPFLDIGSLVGSRGSEQGLLGLAFHPSFAENGQFFVDYTNVDGNTVVARFFVSDDPDRADPSSGREILTIAQPAPNPTGGNLVFGPDGYLWIGTGDGGGGGDRFGNSQNLNSLLGKMLRIDVDGQSPYGIPPDNPFVDVPDARPEIWAYGLRNPWRYSFDRATHDLYIADVGQGAWEEIDVQRAGEGRGATYGWPRMEGAHCYPPGAPCDASGLVFPVAEYDHGAGCSITGGYVYRVAAFPQLYGLYVYGDYCSGRLWALDAPTPGTWRRTLLQASRLQPTSFGEDESGELYLVSQRDHALYQLTAE